MYVCGERERERERDTVYQPTLKYMYMSMYGMYTSVYYHIAGNFYQEKFSPILPPILVGETFYPFFSCVNVYIHVDDAVTFYCIGETTLA